MEQTATDRLPKASTVLVTASEYSHVSDSAKAAIVLPNRPTHLSNSIVAVDRILWREANSRQARRFVDLPQTPSQAELHQAIP